MTSSPHSPQIVEFIKNHKFDSRFKEIVFFGGSFNPWHSGHGSCLSLMDKDKLIIVMPDHNPFKDVTKEENRFSSLTDIKKELKIRPENTYLFEGFIQDANHNPTHNWLRQVKDSFPNLKLSLLMGFDSFMSIDKWIEAKQIIKDTSCIYVASRLDNKEARQSQYYLLKSMDSDIEVDFIGHHDYEHLSSTEIRKN